MAKLLVSDYDGTLFNVTDFEKNIQAIAEFVDKGNYFVIASGRHSESLVNDIKKYNIPCHYMICNDGGIVFDKDKKVIYKCDIPKQLVQPIINDIESSDCISYWFIDTGLSISKEYVNTANGIIGRITDVNSALKLLNTITNKYHDIGGYFSENWINVTEKSVNKGNAIKIINNSLKISDDNIYTFGNGSNDIPMSNFNSYCLPYSNKRLLNICKGTYNSLNELIEDILKEKI